MSESHGDHEQHSTEARPASESRPAPSSEPSSTEHSPEHAHSGGERPYMVWTSPAAPAPEREPAERASTSQEPS